MKIRKLISTVLIGLFVGASIAACTSEADSANDNLSRAAENFEVPRRIVGINTITDSVLFSVEGFCSYETDGDVIEAICLVDRANDEVSRTTMGKADNVTFISTQLEGVKVDMFRPRIIFRPETVIPNFDLSTSLND